MSDTHTIPGDRSVPDPLGAVPHGRGTGLPAPGQSDAGRATAHGRPVAPRTRGTGLPSPGRPVSVAPHTRGTGLPSPPEPSDRFQYLDDPAGLDPENLDDHRLAPGRESAKAISRRPRRSRSGYRWGLEWVLVVLGTIAVSLLVRAFLVQTFVIPTESMVPTLQKNDRVVVNRLAYIRELPRRGDVVVFSKPPTYRPDDPEAPRYLIKRVIGLPGETVEARDDELFIDGEAVDESEYLGEEVQTVIHQPIEVPDGELLVLGDNRTGSEDGRYFGTIDESLLVGRAEAVIWPLGRAEGL